jgi:hypothetical protein
MIELANDPNASRAGFRPEPGDDAARGEALAARRRTGHAWPFPSRYAQLPARNPSDKPSAGDSGS